MEKTLEQLLAEKAEIDKLIEQKKKEEALERELKDKKKVINLLKAIESNKGLLEFISHSRNSCGNSLSNAYFHNGYARCNRCLLEEMFNDYMEDFDKESFEPRYNIDLSIQVYEFK